MTTLYETLKQNLQGDVHFDELHKTIYSVDASIFEVKPVGVVLPKNKEDLLLAMCIAAEHHTPVIARGAATGITGGCLGKGLIIDTSKYLNRILEINIDEEYVICEPGVVQDRLNEALAPYDYRLGPDTSTGNRATLGGMLANNAAGSRSLYYGRMIDHVEEVELAIVGGRSLVFSELNEEQLRNKCELGDFEGELYRNIVRILNSNRKAIDARFPKIPRHVSGYNLDALLNFDSFNLSKLIVGSEGSLGIVTKIKVKIAKKPAYTGLCVIHSQNMIHDLNAIETLLSHHPMALELVDNKILSAARSSPALQKKLEWLNGDPQAIFIAEFAGVSHQEVDRKLTAFSSLVSSINLGYSHILIQDPQQVAHVWEVRKAGLGLLLSKRSYSRAIAFIEDLSIAPAKLPAFMAQFNHYLKSVNKEAGIYGHVGSGCMHIRPYIDLRSHDELALMKKMMQDVSTMVLAHSGALSGEHGDGLIRSWLNEKMFGKEVYQAFIDIKNLFDPNRLMNPGKIVEGAEISNLRTQAGRPLKEIKTFLDFSKEGGFTLAADLCNGNGQCRKAEKVMCPSFQATRDEYDTTRARAQALRGVIHGNENSLTDQSLYDVLDLCLECKGCKTECPSQVDMAKMKSEVLYQYQEKHGYSFRSRIFAHMHAINRLFSPFARLFNAISRTYLSKMALKLLGITPQRKLPSLAKERFSTWFHKQPKTDSSQRVVLFNDTYTEFNEPEIGKAAYQVLSALKYNIILAENLCCGRPLISKGFLKEAKKNAEHVVEALFPFANGGISIVGLEPSCFSALHDDYQGLLNNTSFADKLKKIREHCISFDQFLQQHISNGTLPLSIDPSPQQALIHGHCHQKSLIGMQPTLDVLRSAGITPHEIDSGCCGVAGSFGYEEEHYDLSMKIGSLKLFPAVNDAEASTILVASGISCRSQIHHGTGRRAMHLAEAISQRLKDDRNG